MSHPVPGAYPLPIGVGDAESLTRDAWVAVLRAEPSIWGGDASASYAVAREADLDAARQARERVAEAVLALEVLHASRVAAFLAFQGVPPPGFLPPGPPPRVVTPPELASDHPDPVRPGRRSAT